MRLGLIGCGWIVERCHAPALRQAGADVVAVADPAPARRDLVGELVGVDTVARYDDFRALLARDDLDAVSVATPPTTHREIVEAAAARGLHVICEKPLAVTLADCDAMIEAAAAAGVALAVYHNYLFFPGTRTLRELIAGGAIGDVVATQIRGLALRPWAGTDAYRPGWRLSLADAGGGAMIDVGVHAAYLTEALQGAPAIAVSAQMHYDRPGVDATVFCQLRLASGGAATIQAGWRHGDGALAVYGTEGYLAVVYDEHAGYFGAPMRAVREFGDGQPARTHPLPHEHLLVQPDLYRGLAAALAGDRAAYPAYGEDGRRALEVALAAYAADARRAWIELPLAPDDPVYRRGVAALV